MYRCKWLPEVTGKEELLSVGFYSSPFPVVRLSYSITITKASVRPKEIRRDSRIPYLPSCLNAGVSHQADSPMLFSMESPGCSPIPSHLSISVQISIILMKKFWSGSIISSMPYLSAADCSLSASSGCSTAAPIHASARRTTQQV